MVSPIDDMTGDRSSIFEVRLSTVVPASITEEDKTYQFTDADLAMKLHYITTVHFYGADAVDGLEIHDFKRPMFQWLQLYYPICGRIRRHDADGGGGRPFIKCNDSGVRIVEAKCTKTLAEWLEGGVGDHHRLLVYHQPILAHDFGFTPLVFLQLTKFKCGGLCVGMRWAHILGDAFSASKCINAWGAIMSNQATPPTPLSHSVAPVDPTHQPPPSSASCRSLELLEHPLGDNWLTPNNAKMQMHTFNLTEQHLAGLLDKKTASRYCDHDNHQVILKPFELICAVVWKSLARIRGTDDAKTIVVVSKRGGDWFDCHHRASDTEESYGGLLGNTHQAIGVVEAEGIGVVVDGDPFELARMIGEKLVDETELIERCAKDESRDIDCVVYGSKLTFLNLEDVDVHGLEIKGRKPVYAGLSVGGVRDGGAVVVGPDAMGEGKKGGGRTLSVVLPEDEVQHLKNELKSVWGIS